MQIYFVYNCNSYYTPYVLNGVLWQQKLKRSDTNGSYKFLFLKTTESYKRLSLAGILKWKKKWDIEFNSFKHIQTSFLHSKVINSKLLKKFKMNRLKKKNLILHFPPCRFWMFCWNSIKIRVLRFIRSVSASLSILLPALRLVFLAPPWIIFFSLPPSPPLTKIIIKRIVHVNCIVSSELHP